MPTLPFNFCFESRSYKVHLNSIKLSVYFKLSAKVQLSASAPGVGRLTSLRLSVAAMIPLRGQDLFSPFLFLLCFWYKKLNHNLSLSENHPKPYLCRNKQSFKWNGRVCFPRQMRLFPGTEWAAVCHLFPRNFHLFEVIFVISFS